jgi:F0F1-type ATP synthase assembly protein I
MGFTFASMIIAGGLLGFGLSWVLDQPENKRVFIVLGTVVGIIIGMVDFIRAARRAIREIDR